MLLHTFTLVTGIILALTGCLYAVLASVAMGWARRRTSYIQATPVPITVLKPLCGAEPGLYRQLRSFCRQDYRRYQLVFGVQDPDDPALPVVRRLQQEFRGHDMSIVIDPLLHGTNRKVSNLINMLPHAHHAHLVIADSDVNVPRDYLARLAPALCDPRIGLVTCAYRARPGPGLPAAFVATFVNDWFMPSVFIAAMFGARTFVSGATIAIRADVLRRIGGLRGIVNQLADDHALGAGVRRLGLRVALAPLRVDVAVEEPDAGAAASHVLRWLRTIRSISPAGYACCWLSFSLPLAVAGAALSGFAPAALGLLATAALARLALHALATTRPRRRGELALLPVYDGLLAALWGVGFARREVLWRQQRLGIGRDGALHQAGSIYGDPS